MIRHRAFVAIVLLAVAGACSAKDDASERRASADDVVRRALAVGRFDARIASQLALRADGDGFVASSDGTFVGGRRRMGTSRDLVGVSAAGSASGAVELSLPGAPSRAVSLRPVGTRPVAGRIAGGHVVYPDALEDGTDLLVTSDATGVELLALVQKPTARISLAWTLTTSEALDVVSGVGAHALELVDARGGVQLVVPTAYAVDAHGTRRDVELAWDKTTNRLSLTLDTRDLAFPVLVDPIVSTAVWSDLGVIDVARPTVGGAIAYDGARDQIVLFGGQKATGDTSTRVLDARTSNGWVTHRAAYPVGEVVAARDNALVFDDPVSKKVVLFGGNGPGSDFADTWSWDGSSWSRPPTKAPAPPPSTTSDGPAVYHEASRRTLVWTRSGGFTWDGLDWAATSAGPSPRRGAAMTYDAEHARVVLFGGRDAADERPLDDTWLFDGATWSLATPTTRPPARFGTALAYDPERRRVVMFGGSPESGDTWTWDGSQWSEAASSPANRPTARAAANVFRYDPDRKVLVLSGGFRTSNGTFLGDTWTWNGSSWTQRSGGTPPSPRLGSASGYDRAGKRLVVHGGQAASGGDSRTWTWDGSSWTELTSREPSARAGSCVAYDRARSNVLLFGGGDFSKTELSVIADTWTWNGRWEQKTTPAAMSARALAGTVYDSKNENVVLFGGVTGAANNLTFQSDTWIWNGSWKQAATTPPLPSASAPVLVFDEARNNVVLFEGASNNILALTAQLLSDTTWTWTGSAWKKATGKLPPARRGAAIVYDRERAQVLLFGGADANGNHLADTWLWNGSDWNQATVPGPAARARPGIVYDEANRRVLLFGGDSVIGPLQDTWLWDGNAWAYQKPSATTPSRFQPVLQYNPQLRRVIASGGASTETWSWDGAAWSVASSTRKGDLTLLSTLVFDEARQNTLRFGGLAIAADATNVGDVSILGVVASTATLTFRGAACQSSADCDHGGSCVDGVCCSQSSCGTCERCDSPARSGVCAPVLFDEDPDTCANDRTCNGDGRCGLVLGKTCSRTSECASGHCVDGVCCDSACEGQCEACNTAALGLCRPTRGKPHGARPACAGAGPSAPDLCENPACDGTDANRTSCSGTVGPCAPYLCGAEGCSTTCTVDTECDSSATCDRIAGRCRSNAAAVCVDDHTLFRGRDQTTLDCRPFACAGDACNAVCTSIKDCASPNECSRAGVCVAPLGELPPEEVGCTTGRTRPGRSSSYVLLMLALGIGAWRRRRRTGAVGRPC